MIILEKKPNILAATSSPSACSASPKKGQRRFSLRIRLRRLADITPAPPGPRRHSTGPMSTSLDGPSSRSHSRSYSRRERRNRTRERHSLADPTAPALAATSASRATAASTTVRPRATAPELCAEAIASATTDETTVAPTAEAAVERINCAFQRLFDAHRVPHADQVPVGHTLVVCDATEQEWTAYVESEQQAFRSRFVLWDETSQQIVVIEFPSVAHEYFAEALHRRIDVPALEDFLTPCGASYDSTGRRYEPDLSYGPWRRTTELLGALPPPGGTHSRDYKTLRVEVGVSQGWGRSHGQLDFKALDVWARRPCIAYVLCVKVDEDLLDGSYKLYQCRQLANVVAPALPRLQLIPTPIVPPATLINLETRYLLGLPDHAVLPINVPNRIRIDLYAVLTTARARLNP